jgi:uncharacterized ferredoxin-like protein
MPEHYIEEWPPYVPNDMERRQGVLIAARLAANAAITAPKGGGVPIAEAHIVYGEKEMVQVAKKMVELADVNPSNEMWRTIFKTEAEMVRMTDVILFLGCHVALNPFDITCDYCSGPGKGCTWLYEQRKSKYGILDEEEVIHPDWLIDGPFCTWRIVDFGLAIGTALKVAKKLFVDCRLMMSVGIAGQKLGYCPKSPIVVGIPMASLSKDPYADVLMDYHLFSERKYMESARMRHVITRMVQWLDYRHWHPQTTEVAKKWVESLEEKGKE